MRSSAVLLLSVARICEAAMPRTRSLRARKSRHRHNGVIDVEDCSPTLESRTYERWSKTEQGRRAKGRFVAVCGDLIEGPFASSFDAQRAGVERFGRKQVYIFEVGAPEPPVREI